VLTVLPYIVQNIRAFRAYDGFEKIVAVGWCDRGGDTRDGHIVSVKISFLRAIASKTRQSEERRGAR